MSVPNPFRGDRMPVLVPWDDELGFAVFADLDPCDWAEATVTLGRPVTAAGLWADWRSVRGARLFDVVALSGLGLGRVPFAVVGVSNTGVAGVAEVALLTRDAGAWRGEIARLAAGLRRVLPSMAREAGVHRIEARTWGGHPTGGRLLRAVGLPLECSVPGFGPGGTETYDQHAWTAITTNPAQRT